MNPSEYQIMKDVQNGHWWWEGRQKIAEALLEKYLVLNNSKINIADVGAGYGANIPMLSKFGRVAALEMNKDCLQFIRERERERERETMCAYLNGYARKKSMKNLI